MTALAVLDHLTVAALTLQDGVGHVRRALGVTAPPGGAHPLMGTHNHLMQLGKGVFLEIIAPDPDAAPQRIRWFGLDDAAMRQSLRVSPRLISWVVRVADIAQALEARHQTAGEAVRLTRGSLSWLISVRRDGSMPFDGAFPALIEWPEPHPSGQMADLGCRFERLSLAHPDAPRLSAALASLVQDDRIAVSTGAACLKATIRTPYGLRELS